LEDVCRFVRCTSYDHGFYVAIGAELKYQYGTPDAVETQSVNCSIHGLYLKMRY